MKNITETIIMNWYEWPASNGLAINNNFINAASGHCNNIIAKLKDNFFFFLIFSWAEQGSKTILRFDYFI